MSVLPSLSSLLAAPASEAGLLGLFQLLLVSPLLAGAHLLSLPACQRQEVRELALAWSLVVLALSLLLYLFFMGQPLYTFQLHFRFGWTHALGLNLAYGLDGLGLVFLLLTTLLIPLCLLASWESTRFSFRSFALLLFLTEFLLLQAFSLLDLLLFYVFFEAVLIPMYLLIGVWGPHQRRLEANYQFFLYTFAGSLAMLLAILFLYAVTGTTDYQTLLRARLGWQEHRWLWAAFFFAFAVKTPLFPFHLWLTEAHVEAPTPGSLLLAGIMLKLGLFGMVRYCLVLFAGGFYLFAPLVGVLCLLGMFYASLSALRQTDLKKIIAYSSIAHMSLALLGILSATLVGVVGGLLLAFSHGLVSCGLFSAVGLLYDRYGTRSLYYYGGLAGVAPLYGLALLFFCLANLGLPGTSGFPPEVLVYLGLASRSSWLLVLSLLTAVLTAAYILWMYNRLVLGLPGPHLRASSDLNARERSLLGLLVLLILLLGVVPGGLTELLHNPASFALERVQPGLAPLSSLLPAPLPFRP